MKKRNFLVLMSAVLVVCVLSSCCTCGGKNKKEDEPIVYKRVDVTATYTSTPVVIDGKLDDDVWMTTPSYLYKQNALPYRFNKYTHDIVRKTFSPDTVEPGYVRIAYDDNYLYCAFDMTDSDLIAEGEGNQQHDYLTGDVAEIFLKPENASYYWEIYLSPRNSQTVFFFQARSLVGLPSGFPKESPIGILPTGVQLKGTLNDLSDRDIGWTGEIAIPIAEINKLGVPFGPGNKWRIFFGRYNYSQYLPEMPENTSFPQLPGALNYHDQQAYGYLNFAE